MHCSPCQFLSFSNNNQSIKQKRLPDPQPAHATIMARFASECKQKMTEMTSELEASLGPDCSDLKMRFGMHSGPVTAGVLMGDRARFQLFGDTVNTGTTERNE